MAAPNLGNLQQTFTCSVCLELVDETNRRSTANLICGHRFHLDCIGSAFNAKGTMQCPNCRKIEEGQWLYSNRRSHGSENLIPEDEEVHDSDFEMFAHMPEILFAEDLIRVDHNIWCPYHGSYTEVTMFIGYGHPHPVTHAGAVGNMLGGGDNAQSVHQGPFGPRQAHPTSHSPSGMEGNAETPENFRTPSYINHHRRHGAPHLHRVPTSAQWTHPSPAGFRPVGGAGFQGQFENQLAGRASSLQQWNHRGQRQMAATSTLPAGQTTSSQSGSMPSGWGYSGASASSQNTHRATEAPTNNVEPMNNVDVRQRRRTSRQRSAPTEGGFRGFHQE